MNEKVKELIAVGASVSAHCQPCLSYHVSKAKDLGIKKGEIVMAVEIGQMVQKGASLKMKEFAQVLLKRNPLNNEPCCPTGGPGDNECCCK